jgi:hypothetical protein
MGLDIPPTQEWLKEFTDSQFCLSIRGNTPHTHTLLRAVRVGCIPAVVSNFYPIFAPTLTSKLAMEDLSIFIKEYDFRMDMGGELRRSVTLNKTFLRNTTKYLAWAQRVIFRASVFQRGGESGESSEASLIAEEAACYETIANYE